MPNPGVGGWACILLCPAKNLRKELSGNDPDTTNNRMELTSIIEGLKALKNRCQVLVVTDSQYTKNGIERWIHGWKKNGWKNSHGKAVKNKDLWEEFDALREQHEVIFQWTKGHDGDTLNERCDELATQAIRNIK